MTTLVHQWLRLYGRAVAWVAQAVWPESSQLLGWFGLCGHRPGSKSVVQDVWLVTRAWVVQAVGRGLVSGSGCMARVYAWVAGQLLGWFRLCGRGLASCLDGMARV